MGNGFKPLRRKFGVVTLLIACVFVVGLVRSQALIDYCRIDLGVLGDFEIVSAPYGLTIVTEGEDIGHLPWHFRFDYSSIAHIKDSTEWGSQFYDIRRQNFLACQHGNYLDPVGNRRAFLTVKYWMFLIPLTLLSEWLLLSRPVKSIQTA